MRSVRDCEVAVIGGAGFLGSHLVDHLIEDRGCRVTVLDNLCAGRREFINRKADFIHADITGSEHFLLDVFRRKKIRYVMSYAAWPYVPNSYERPLHVFDVNCFGAIKVINAAQEAGVEAILQVSSAEVYGKFGGEDRSGPGWHGKVLDGKISEDEPVVPHSSYGASKAAVDSYCQVAWRERQTPVIALRQFNCVGERETHPYVIPEIIGQLAKQQQGCTNGFGMTAWWPKADDKVGTVKLGNNSARDFIYAGDAVRIAVELLERGTFGDVYNLGSEGSIKIYDLAERIGRLMGFASVKVERDEARVRPWEIWALRASNEKLWSVLEKGRPKVGYWGLTPLDEALRRTIRWYEEQGRVWPWE